MKEREEKKDRNEEFSRLTGHPVIHWLYWESFGEAAVVVVIVVTGTESKRVVESPGLPAGPSKTNPSTTNVSRVVWISTLLPASPSFFVQTSRN